VKIGVICRRNQARSPNLSRILSHLYPEIDFWSAGISVINSGKFKTELNLFSDFGIPIDYHYSIDLKEAFLVNRDSDLIIVTNSEMEDYARAIGINCKIVSLDRVAKKFGLRVTDPINFPKALFDFEIAKYLLMASLEILSFSGEKTVLGLIPKGPDSVANLYNLLDMQMESGASVLHTGLKYRSNFKALKRGRLVISTHEGDWAHLCNQNEEPFAIESEYELSDPLRILFSSAWQNNIKELKKDRKLILSSSPMFTRLGVPNLESIIGLLGSTELHLVN